MEPADPVLFFRGEKKTFDTKRHVERTFLGDDGENKNDRFKSYRLLYDKIKNKYLDFRNDAFQEPLDSIVIALDRMTATSISQMVSMVAVTFSDIDPLIPAFFDTLSKDERLGSFYIARLKGNPAPHSVEMAVASVVEQLEDPDIEGRDGTLNSLLKRWARKDAKEEGKYILIIVDNIMELNTRSLEDFLLVLSLYKSLGLPIFVVAGFPQSRPPVTVLPHSVLRKYALEIVTVSMDGVKKSLLDFVASSDTSFLLSPQSFKILVSGVTEGGIPIDEQLNILKLVALEHFRKSSEKEMKEDADDNSSSTRANRKSWRNAGQKKTPKRRSSATNDKRQLSQTDDCCLYRIGQNIFSELIHSASSARSASAKVDESSFESASFSTIYSLLSNLEEDQLDDFISFCESVTEAHAENGIIGEFRRHLGNAKNAETVASKTQICTRNRPNATQNPKLAKLQAGLESKKRSVGSNVLVAKPKHLATTLKDFFNQTCVLPAVGPTSSTVIFPDDFLQQLLSPSSRNSLVAALSAANLYAAYEQAGHNIDLADWFEKFAEVTVNGSRRRAKENVTVAKFYKMLSSLEYVGLVAKGRKDRFVTKLCWTMPSVQCTW